MNLNKSILKSSPSNSRATPVMANHLPGQQAGTQDLGQIRKYFPEKYHDFIDECATSAPKNLGRITEAYIEKFLAKKPEFTEEGLLKMIPSWLHDLYDAFRPELADQLPPH
ncbi:hypothetical protein K3495_g348 [Podosphaera aphanis]|nr:hypothetical protein K3495_g348 [Podosphaera aphanis]